MLASALTSLRHFRFITNVVFVKGVSIKYEAFCITLYLDHTISVSLLRSSMSAEGSAICLFHKDTNISNILFTLNWGTKSTLTHWLILW